MNLSHRREQKKARTAFPVSVLWFLVHSTQHAATYSGDQKKDEGSIGLMHFVNILTQWAIAIKLCTMSYRRE